MQIMFHISRHRHPADHQHSPHNNDNNATSLEIQRFCLCLANDPTLLAKQRFCLCLAVMHIIQRFSPHFLFQSLISFSFCFLHQKLFTFDPKHLFSELIISCFTNRTTLSHSLWLKEDPAWLQSPHLRSFKG